MYIMQLFFQITSDLRQENTKHLNLCLYFCAECDKIAKAILISGGVKMEVAKTVLLIVQIIVALFLIVTVLLQHGNSYGLSGSIAGGAETFFGKNKGRTIDGMLKKMTEISAVLFVVISLVLAYLLK